MADPELQIRGGGGHQKTFLRPFGPQFGLQISVCVCVGVCVCVCVCVGGGGGSPP